MAGSGPFGLLTSAFGQHDVRDDIADYQAQQLTRNRAAAGLDPDGNPLPAPPAGAPPPAAPVQIQTQDPNQTPQAHKTPADLGTLLMRLGQQEESNQGFNQALGMGFAAFAQPRDREMVSKMFNTNLQDPNALGRTLFEANNQQAGQDQTNAIRFAVNDPQKGPKIAEKLRISWEALKTAVAADPGAAGKIATALGMPSEELRNLAQLGEMGGADGNKGPLGDVKTQIVSGIGGPENTAMTEAQTSWDTKHPGQPTPWNRNDLESYKQWSQDQGVRQTNAQEFASKNHGMQIGKVTDFQHQVEGLKTDPGMNEIMANPNAYRQAMKWIMQHKDDNEEQLAAAMPDWLSSIAHYTPQVKNALVKLQMLRSRDYSNAMHSIGQRFSTQEVQNVSKGMDSLLNLELSKDDYNEGLDHLLDETKTIRANSHGAAQEFETMDPELRTYVNPTFVKGGRANVSGSGSEDWADKVKPPKSEIDAAKAALDKGVPRPVVERRMRAHGFRPMGF